MLLALQLIVFLVLALAAGTACALLNGDLKQRPALIFHGAVALVAFVLLAPLKISGEPAAVLMGVVCFGGITAFMAAGRLEVFVQRFGIETAGWRASPFSFACAVLAGSACAIASVPALACGLIIAALISVARTDTPVHQGLTPDMPGVGVFLTPEQRAAIYPAVIQRPRAPLARPQPQPAEPAT